MKFTITKNPLLAELTLCSLVAAKRSTIPILQNVLLTAKRDHLEIVATDLDTTIRSRVPANIETPGAITIDAARFRAVINSLEDGAVKIDGAQTLQIASGVANFQLNALPAEQYPTLPEIGPTILDIPSAKLRLMLRKVGFAVSDEETRFTLNGTLLAQGTKMLEIVATDGHRLAVIKCDHQGEPTTLFLPKGLVRAIMRTENTSEVWKLSANEDHIGITDGRRDVISRRMDMSFPDYNTVIRKTSAYSATANRDGLLRAIERVSLLSNQRTKMVVARFDQSGLRVTVENPDEGQAIDVVPIEYKGEPMSIGFNADYARDFLKIADVERIQIDLNGESDQILSSPVGESEFEYQYVQMPMRISA